MLRFSMPALAVAALVAMDVGLPGSALAAEPVHGRELARRWCASCHMVEPGQTASDVAPAFTAVAQNPQITREALKAWLAKPHPPMPDLSLSRQDEDDVLAYILSLRSQ